MQQLEIILLVLAYTTMVLSLFLEFICYKRNIEALETIFLTTSLLLLISVLTASGFFYKESTPLLDWLILFAMILVGLATPLNVLEERRHQISPAFKKYLLALAIGLVILIVIGHFTQTLERIQYVVVVFLVSSVVFSMFLIRTTKPKLKMKHREKIERFTSLAFLIIVPISLGVNYITELQGFKANIGFTLPLVFIILAISKLRDDIGRLSLIKPKLEVQAQNIKNYGLTNRETEVALLLVKGSTYKQVSEQLFISLPTVKTHVSNIYKKCKINNKTELMLLLNA